MLSVNQNKKKMQIKAPLNCHFFTYWFSEEENLSVLQLYCDWQGYEEAGSHPLLVESKTLQALWTEQFGNKFQPKLKCA